MDLAAEFPGLAETTYLNSCAHGLLSRRVRRAIDAHLDRWTNDPDWGAWGEASEKARAAFARFIGARTEDVALQANASSGLAAVMNALQPGERNRIVTCDLDFPTAPYLAQLQETRGFRHTHVRTGMAAMSAEEFARELDEQTALASIPAVASFTGYKLDVQEFVEEAQRVDAPLLVDAFQAAGTYPINVRDWDVDFLVTGVYKWLMAPAGLGFLYVRPDHHDLPVTTAGWYGQENPAAFDPLSDPASDARRFQYGGPSVIGCVAVAESLALLEEVGLANVAKRSRALVERVMDHARERKFEVLTPPNAPDRASIVTFRVPELEKCLAACQRERVVVNTRLEGIRVSPHFYNRESDVDRLFDVLDAALA